MNITEIKGIGITYAKKLKKVGITRIEDLREMSIEEIAKKSKISPLLLTKWKKEAYLIRILRDIKGIGPTFQKKLEKKGIKSIEDLASADAHTLAKKTGIPEKKIEKWISDAKELMKKRIIKKAFVAEKIGPENAHIHIKEGTAIVKIKEKIHQGVSIFNPGEENKAQNEDIAVIIKKQDAKLWFKGKWDENITLTEEKMGMMDKIKKILWGET